MAEAGLGIADPRALDDVTHVIHCAATVAFDDPLDEARRINVGGAEAMISLCRRLPKLERLDAVSDVLRRGPAPRSREAKQISRTHRGFHNTYEQTKYE